MKKNNYGGVFSKSFLIKVMRAYILLFLITICRVFSSEGYSQRVSLNFENIELEKIFREIESRSDYSFFYSNNVIDNSQRVSINVQDEKLERTLQLLFQNTNIDFTFVKNQIVLFPRDSVDIKKEIEELIPKNQSFIDEEEVKDYVDSLVKIIMQNPITGTVVDNTGYPLPGATVLIRGTDTGVQTDFDGNFTIQAKPGDILVISYVGFETVEVTATKKPLKVALLESVNQLNEVIITGYGVQRKSRVTGSAANLDLSAITGVPRAAVQESIQGNIAGVLVTSSSGQPGATPNVRIRGVGSFDSAFPLYVIDGFQTTDAGVIASLNPNDIEAISVLKDAASTSIYGTRGANGVIVIQTKSGRDGKTKVSYSTQSGFTSATVADRFKPLNTSELQELLVEGVQNAGIRNTDTEALDFLVSNGFNPDIDTDWYDLITRDGLYQQHDLSVRGGGEKTRFFLSGGYFNQEGIILGSGFERMNSRLKLDHHFSDRLKTSAYMSYNKSISKVRPTGGAFANPVRSIYRLRSDISPFNDDGTFNFDFNNTHNPIAQAQQEIRRNITHRILAGANLSYDIIDGLAYESVINMNQTFQDQFLRLPAGFGDGRPTGRGEQDSNFLFTWLFRNMLKYNKSWNDHNVSAFAGYELQKVRNKFSDLTVENIPDGFEDLNNGSLPTLASTEKVQSGLNSVFLNAEYSFADTYLISGSIRRDGSSSFGSNNRYANFWSVGVGWNIANESFMDALGFINTLKFRASYGENGNDPVSGIFNLFSVNDYDGNPGLVFSDLGNPDIKWEVNKPLNIGLDYSFFNGRILGSFDWYKRETTDLLRNRPISATNGDTSIAENIGSMENTGIEFDVTTRNLIETNHGFSWNTNFNITINRNEVTKLSGDNEPIIGTTSIIAVGEDFETFYLPVYAGVDPANGNALWYTDETRSEITANYNNADQAIIGRATPDFYAGLRNTISYKGLSLDFQLYTAWGGLVYDTWNRFTNSDGSRRLATTGNVSRGTYERRWQRPGDITDVPAFVYGNTQTGSSSQRSSRFIYDGSYVRLREVSLAYQLPNSAIGVIGLSTARIYLKGNNLYTFLKDDRLERDPEAGSDGRLNQEIPISKAIFLGLDITF